MTQRVIQAKLHRHAGRFTFAFFTTDRPFDLQGVSVIRRRCINNSDRGFGDLEFRLYEEPTEPTIQRFGIFPAQERIRQSDFEGLLRTHLLQGTTLSMSWVSLTDLPPYFLRIATVRLIKLQQGGA